MIVLKMYLHLKALFKYAFFKLVYGSKFEVGKSVTWRNNFSLMIAEQGQVEIGNNVFFNNGCSINANKLVRIGEGTLFGENVKIYDHNHRFRDKGKSIKEQGFSNGDVIIGKHCWIGSNVVILKGANIGDNCVIGAGCVINNMIKSDTIIKVEGNYSYSKY